jgi:hypothetical protein
VYVVSRRQGVAIYGEVGPVGPPFHRGRASSIQDQGRLPTWPDYWLEGHWYSVNCLEGEWGRLDPLQPDLREISREEFESARSRGWQAPAPR